MSQYHKRLEMVNKTEEKTVLDCVDRPIRQLVFELNRIGLRTKFSCCGFPYRGEEEPKTHAKFPFVVLHCPVKNQDKLTLRRIEAFFSFVRCVEGTGWLLHQYHGNGEWYLSGEKYSQGEQQFYRQQEGERGIHDYETMMIAIQALTRKVAGLPTISDEFTVEDGNTMYAGPTQGEWQIDPKPPVTFSEKQNNVEIN